jgi:hypothetical protein
LTLDPGWEKFGSGIKILDPQHCFYCWLPVRGVRHRFRLLLGAGRQCFLYFGPLQLLFLLIREDDTGYRTLASQIMPVYRYCKESDVHCTVKSREIAFYEHRESISRVLIQNFQKPAYKSIQTILI